MTNDLVRRGPAWGEMDFKVISFDRERVLVVAKYLNQISWPSRQVE